MAGIIVGSVGVAVVPNAQNWSTALREQTLPASARVGDEIGKTIGERIMAKVRTALPDALAQSGRTAGAQGGKAGDDYGGKFADTMRARVDAALKSLPKGNVGLDATDADRKLEEIRAQLAALRDARVGVDISDAEAVAKIAILRAELARLGAESPDVRMQVDTAAADAKLAEFEAEIRAIGAQSPNVRVDVDDGGSIARTEAGMGGLMATGLALGPALIPVAAALAAAFAGVAAAIGVGLAGIGVGILGFSGITGAVKALNQEQSKAGKGAVTAANQQRNAANTIASAQAQLKSAEASLANTRANAADAQIRADEQVRNAEQQLRQAQQDAVVAQQALTEARKAAAQQMQDLTLQVQDGALAQRQANIDLANAKLDLDAVMADPRATLLQRQQAQLAYDQAKQQIVDLGVQQSRLQAQKAAADKAGVNGSQQVIAAQRGVDQANQRELDARQSLADAIRAQTNQQRQNAYAVSQAQAQVANAMRAVAQASQQTGAASSSAFDKAKSALAGLTPAGRDFVTFLRGTLLPRLHELKSTAQSNLLPGVQSGLEAMLPLFPSLNRFVGSLARALGDLFAQAGRAFNSPFWRSFFAYMQSVGAPMLSAIGHIIGNIVTGFAGLIQAFAPVTAQIGSGLLNLSRGFAAFGRNASTNKSVQAFLAYIRREGPVVASTIGAIFRAVGHVVVALAPLGGVVLQIVGALANFIAKIPPSQIRAIVLALAGLVVVQKVAGWVEGLQKTFEKLGIGSPVLLAIAAVALGFYLLYTRSKTFHDFINNQVVPLLRGVFTPVFNVVRRVIDSVRSAIAQNRPQLEELLHAFEKVSGFVLKIVVPVLKYYLINTIRAAGVMITATITILGGLVRAFNWVINTAKSVGGWISRVFRGVVGAITGAWHTVASSASSAWHGIRTTVSSTVSWITGKFNSLVGFFAGMPGKIGRATKGMFKGIGNAFIDAINVVIGLWDKLNFSFGGKKIAGHTIIPGFSFGLPHIDKIPHLAAGGTVVGQGMALVGDRGPELLDLPLGARVTPLTSGPAFSPGDIAGGDGASLSALLRRTNLLLTAIYERSPSATGAAVNDALAGRNRAIQHLRNTQIPASI